MKNYKDHPAYAAALKRFTKYSVILNDRNDRSVDQTPWIPGERNNVMINLAILKGDDDGHYYRNNNPLPSKKLQVQEELTELESNYKEYARQQINSGKSAKDPEWPENMAQKYCTKKAEQVVIELEISKVEKVLDEFVASETEILQRLFLKTPLGRTKLSGGFVAAVDGQRCGINDEGLPVIKDEKSPYNTMPVHRYLREIAMPHSRETKLRNRQERKEAKEQGRTVRKRGAKLPKWNKETDTIEYDGYSTKTLQILKDKVL